jgi:hypothetical protein
MKITSYIVKHRAAMLLLSFGVAVACQPEEFDDNGNGLADADINASFTITPVEGKINTYVLAADQTGLTGVKWDKDDGTGFPTANSKAIDTVFYPDAGTYNVTLRAYGRGGKFAAVTKPLVVASPDPKAGNLVQGSRMDAGDASKWTFVTYTPGVTFTLTDGKMIAAGSGFGQAGIYQTIQVEANKKYKVDMAVSGKGATDTWFEVYVGQAVPEAGKDYNDGGKRLALNTWAGCGKTVFSGKLSAISCDGKDNGQFSFATGGTAYLVIRSGGGNLGDGGISIDNVEVRGVQ